MKFKFQKNHFFSTLLAYFYLLAKVSATNSGNINEASENTLANLAFSRIFPQVYASEILAPESLPSSKFPVLMKTP